MSKAKWKNKIVSTQKSTKGNDMLTVEKTKAFLSELKHLTNNSSRTDIFMPKSLALRIYDSWDFLLSNLEQVEKERDALIMAVATKFPNETRFETALRYINERENSCDNQSYKENKCNL